MRFFKKQYTHNENNKIYFFLFPPDYLAIIILM